MFPSPDPGHSWWKLIYLSIVAIVIAGITAYAYIASKTDNPDIAKTQVALTIQAAIVASQTSASQIITTNPPPVALAPTATWTPSTAPIPTNTPQNIPTFTPIPLNITPTQTQYQSSMAQSNCPFREQDHFDDINVGNNSGACATMPLAKFVGIMNGNTVDAAIKALDSAFEADIRIGYQYREAFPVRIPPAPPAQRVLWGSLSWIDSVTEKRIHRIKCKSDNVCIYAIMDGNDFNVGFAGRGILLAEPLLPDMLKSLSK